LSVASAAQRSRGLTSRKTVFTIGSLQQEHPMAFKHVLIPLDGSALSEHAVGLLGAVHTGKAEVTLLKVVGEDEDAQAASAYLQGVASSIEGEVTVLVREAEDPADQILQELTQGEFDLVVMMTHGRSGVKRWVWGSVAEHVVRHCPAPLLLATPQREDAAEPAAKKIFVPLDGSELADKVLDQAKALARELDGELVLFSAVWVEPVDNPLAYTRDLDAFSKMADDMLKAREEELSKEGVKASSFSQRGEAATLILEAAEECGADMIAMTTHGRTGVSRWLLGSVAERVLRASPLPVFLVRTTEEASGGE
jgi:nucleotide-binding universal stress UspA family protein